MDALYMLLFGGGWELGVFGTMFGSFGVCKSMLGFTYFEVGTNM